MKFHRSSLGLTHVFWLLFGLTACAVGPAYEKPIAPESAAFKEANGWVSAAPSDTLARGPWWELFGDAELNALAAKVEVSNQNIAASRAGYAQARALVAEQRAALLPAVNLNAGANRSRAGNNLSLSLGASWELDVWQRLGNVVDSAQSSAQASSADLAAATLSAQAELAVNYWTLRQTDTESALLSSSIEAYRRAQTITQNRYDAGLSAKTDVLQLTNAQADAAGLVRRRATLEHAIAVLLGQAPSNFALAARVEPAARIPQLPPVLPSEVLLRRPDVAAAERRVAAANAQIGVAQAAFYPSFNLNGSLGSSASTVANLFSAPASLWSFGLQAAQVVFKAGALDARMDSARAAHEQAVARYRQVALAAFQSVEDQLAATRSLQLQQQFRQDASLVADQLEQQALNRYRSGITSYSEVTTAQTTALNARRALAQATADRQTTAVALVQALGGGWTAGAGEYQK
jgi:NodT family efflux transporter outer membrane factor (OMF) lipoprotein